ncbi:hypothetical protein [Vibrio vulnificus]|uniref:hypothetical protein n=1 Tax=Vibrio vulnificus TaxID=672 RepID=UPI0019D45741|nr:hypothetical protein [Vibrio vulnificus]MBN8095607.1 hypothetical protein [Vibrio vulnificus]HAS6055557.1 hypothetical protein [Vibrio vulnificus]
MAIESVKAAFDGINFIRQMFDGHVDGVAKDKVSELQQQSNQKVLDIQQVLILLQAQVLEYQQENERLTELLKKDVEIREQLNQYELVKTEGGAVVYKFNAEPAHFACPQCVNDKQVISILQFTDNARGFYNCKGCSSSYLVESAKDYSSITVNSYDPFSD